MNSDQEYQTECLTVHIPDSMISCGDRVNLAFNDMELSAAIKKVGNNEDEIKRLAKGLLYIEELTNIALETIATLQFTDPIEVQLIYQVKLAERLQLPIQTKAMLYERCANISNEDLENAFQRVTENVTEERLQAFLNRFSPWQKLQVFSYAKVPSLQADEHIGDTKELSCSISMCDHDELVEPVYVIKKQNGQVVSVHVFEFDDFMQHWRERFNNPNTRDTVELSQLRRPRS